MLRRGLGAVLAVVAAVGSFVLALAPAAPADALSGSSFMPGLIISDSQFYDSAAMSESQIQQFLTSKGSGLAGFTFSVNSRARVTSSSGATRCEAFQGGVLAASTIIYRAQVACGISAKVLLVTLQKEQGLITKKAPSQSALDRAMGYACPDTAPCAPTTRISIAMRSPNDSHEPPGVPSPSPATATRGTWWRFWVPRRRSER